MQEFLNHIRESNLPPISIVVFLVVSLLLGFGHQILLESIFAKFKFRRLSLIYFALVLGGYVIEQHYALLITILLFLSTFLLAIIAIVITPFVRRAQRNRFREEMDKKRPKQSLDDKPKKPFLYRFVNDAFHIVLFLFLFVHLHIIGVITYFVGRGIFAKWKSRPSLFRLQRSLPTSKIRSVASGLVEIEGKVVIDDFIASRIDDLPCAGYSYFVEEISRDDDGRESFHTVYSDSQFLPFYLEDETGRIKVIPDQLELLQFRDRSYRSAGKRYVEYIIEENPMRTYLMIGQAARKDNEMVIQYDESHRILSMTPSEEVENHEETMKFLNHLKPYFIVFLLWMSLVLSSDIKVTNDGISITFHQYINQVLTVF